MLPNIGNSSLKRTHESGSIVDPNGNDVAPGCSTANDREGGRRRSGNVGRSPKAALHSDQLLLRVVQRHAEGLDPGQTRREDRADVIRIRAPLALGLDGLQTLLGLCRRIGVLDGAGGRVLEDLPLLGLLDEQLLRRHRAQPQRVEDVAVERRAGPDDVRELLSDLAGPLLEHVSEVREAVRPPLDHRGIERGPLGRRLEAVLHLCEALLDLGLDGGAIGDGEVGKLRLGADDGHGRLLRLSGALLPSKTPPAGAWLTPTFFFFCCARLHPSCCAVNPSGGTSRPSSKRNISSRVRCCQRKPRDARRLGIIRWPPRRATSPSSPNAARSAGAGSSVGEGRPSTRESVRVKSRLVTGLGAERLKAPVSSGVATAKRRAPSTSSRERTGSHCRPSPRRPPRPRRKGSSRRSSIPPATLITGPSRGCTTRTPASAAGRAASSHTRHSCAMKSEPLGASSSSTRSPWRWPE